VNDEDVELTAYHEAGHAVVAAIHGGRVVGISLIPESEGILKAGELEIHWPRNRMTDAQIAACSTKVALGGPVAEMLYQGDRLHPGLVAHWRGDWETAWTAAGRQWPDERRRLAMLEHLTAELHRILGQPDLWQTIAALADELQAHEVLEGDEVHEVIEQWLPAAYCRNQPPMF